MLLDRLLGERIDPSRQRVVKFFPNNPPRRFDSLLVDDVPYRVTYSRISWNGCEWTIRSLRGKRKDTNHA